VVLVLGGGFVFWLPLERAIIINGQIYPPVSANKNRRREGKKRRGKNRHSPTNRKQVWRPLDAPGAGYGTKARVNRKRRPFWNPPLEAFGSQKKKKENPKRPRPEEVALKRFRGGTPQSPGPPNFPRKPVPTFSVVVHKPPKKTRGYCYPHADFN